MLVAEEEVAAAQKELQLAKAATEEETLGCGCADAEARLAKAQENSILCIL